MFKQKKIKGLEEECVQKVSFIESIQKVILNTDTVQGC